MAQYDYADGNGNLYTISSTTITYAPVKPEESSSGVYSGGEPKTRNITSEQFEAFHILMNNAISNTSTHINERVKMSGVISVVVGKERKQYILQPGCADLTAIELFLKKMLL